MYLGDHRPSPGDDRPSTDGHKHQGVQRPSKDYLWISKGGILSPGSGLHKPGDGLFRPGDGLFRPGCGLYTSRCPQTISRYIQGISKSP